MANKVLGHDWEQPGLPGNPVKLKALNLAQTLQTGTVLLGGGPGLALLVAADRTYASGGQGQGALIKQFLESAHHDGGMRFGMERVDGAGHHRIGAFQNGPSQANHQQAVAQYERYLEAGKQAYVDLTKQAVPPNLSLADRDIIAHYGFLAMDPKKAVLKHLADPTTPLPDRHLVVDMESIAKAAENNKTLPQSVVGLGSWGDDVKEIQRGVGMKKLKQDDPDPIDGKYGPDTVKAVKEFQKAHDLTADGIVGPDTWAKIRAAQQPSREQRTPPPAKGKSPGAQPGSPSPGRAPVLHKA